MITLLRHATITALAIFTLTLTACGGGGGDNSTNSSDIDTPISSDVAALSTIDNVVGTGETVSIGRQLTIHYEGWLYDAEAKDFHGMLFDSAVDDKTYTFIVGNGEVIDGFDQGVVGMKEGGNRTIIIPSELAYGRNGSGPIPPDTALVFDIELLSLE